MERSRTDLGQRTGSATVLDNAGKNGAQVVAAYGQIISSKKDISIAFNRTYGHTSRHGWRHGRTQVPAYIQESIPKNFNPRCSASGLLFKENPATATAVFSSVGDQRCSISG